MSFPWKTQVVWQAGRPTSNEYNNSLEPSLEAAIEQGKTDGELTNTPNQDGTSVSVRWWNTETDAQAWIATVMSINPISAEIVTPT
jgi:hypothetical protein